MRDAVHSVMIARACERRAQEDVDQGAMWADFMEELYINSRFAFMMACLALESGANALIESSPNISSALYQDFEKLRTISKYELFALLRGKPLDRGDAIYNQVIKVVALRIKFFPL